MKERLFTMRITKMLGVLLGAVLMSSTNVRADDAAFAFWFLNDGINSDCRIDGVMLQAAHLFPFAGDKYENYERAQPELNGFGFGLFGSETLVMNGVQLDGLWARSREMSGLQLSGLINGSDTMSGVQIAVLGNRTDRGNGFQIGLVNIIDDDTAYNDSHMLQIGLLNRNRHGWWCPFFNLSWPSSSRRAPVKTR